MLNDRQTRPFIKSPEDCPSRAFSTDFYLEKAFCLPIFLWGSSTLTFRKKIIGQTIVQKCRLIILIILTSLTFQLSGQTIDSIKYFEPIFFNQNSDTIDSKYFSQLDSVGLFLQSDTTLILQLHAFGNPVENPFFEIVLNRAKHISDYLTSKYNIKMHEHYLTNTNNRGIVGREDWQYSEEERARLRKVEFIINRTK